MAYAAGRATDDDGSPPLAAVRQVLRALGSPDPLTTEAAAGERAEAAAQERFRRQEAVTEALTAAAAARGLFVLLDDVQLGRRAARCRLLVHLARDPRPGPGRRGGHLPQHRARPAGPRCARHWARSPASRPSSGSASPGSASRRSTRSSRRSPGSPSRPASPRPCTVAPRGNPFFVGELGRLLSAAEVTDEQGLPDGVRDAVAARIARLSPAGGTVVRAAAVLGTALDPRRWPPRPAWTCPTCSPCSTRRRPPGSSPTAASPTTWSASRPLWTWATAERMALHARMAAHLTGRSDADTRAAEVAHHLVESLPMGDAAAAVAWSRRAGDRAMAQLAWEQAAAWYGRALDAATGDAADPGAARRTAHRPRAGTGARLRHRRGAPVAAGRGGDRAGVRRRGDPGARRAGDGRRLRLPVGPGRPVAGRGGVGRAADADSDLRARLLAETVVMESWRMPADSGPRSIAALEMAERVGDRGALVEALRARQFALQRPGGRRGTPRARRPAPRAGAGRRRRRDAVGPPVALRRVRPAG